MSDLIPLVMAVVEAAVLRKTSEPRPPLTRIAVLMALFAIFGASLIACLMTSLWIFSIQFVGRAGAPLVVAAALGIVCLGLYINLRNARDLRPQQTRTDAVRLIHDHKALSLSAALLAGFAAGNARK